MIRKFSLILLSIALVVGCSDDRTLDSTTDVSIRVENGRLAFRDLDAFNSTISEFYKMDQDQLTNWRKQFKFKSLDEKLVEVAQSADDDLVVDETYRTFPKSHLYMLNSDGEIKIGESIIWYSKGLKHFVESEEKLAAIKNDPSQSERKMPYTVAAINLTSTGKEKINAKSGDFTHANGLYADNQFPFSWCSNGTQRKYIHELYTFSEALFPDGDGYTYFAYLYLRMKLEYKSGSHSWSPAGEGRSIYWNLATDIDSWDERGDHTNQVQNFVGQAINVTSDQEILLMKSLNWVRSKAGWFNVGITGNVTQQIRNIGPPGPTLFYCNQWVNTWNL